MSQLACAGLGSARDHANAVLKLQSADGSSPFAQPSLIRAALIGACQAAWLLAPDERAVRMKRFRVVLGESQSRHNQFLRGLLEHPVAVRTKLTNRPSCVRRAVTDRSLKRPGFHRGSVVCVFAGSAEMV